MTKEDKIKLIFSLVIISILFFMANYRIDIEQKNYSDCVIENSFDCLYVCGQLNENYTYIEESFQNRKNISLCIERCNIFLKHC